MQQPKEYIIFSYGYEDAPFIVALKQFPAHWYKSIAECPNYDEAMKVKGALDAAHRNKFQAR